ncbi:MAG: Do family serine endopeptidase [bacterium]|nr:Do family serine endopeptidase [bacterium]
MSRRFSAALAIFCVLLWPLGGVEAEPPSSAVLKHLDALQDAFANIAEQTKPAVVSLKIKGSFRHPRLEGRGPPGGAIPRRSGGSGLIVDPRGYILTNNHVIEGAGKIEVILWDNRRLEGEVIGRDPKADLAVIRVKSDEPLPVAKLGDSDKVRIGEWAIAIGSPFGLDQTVTVGVISGTGRSEVGLAQYENYIQTDAAINPGNSGGPLLNLRGEVIGINTAVFSQGGSIGFAIPITMARRIMKQLIEKGRVIRGYIGVFIQPVTEEIAEQFGLKGTEGALVSDVMPDTPASKGGIQRGDVIVKFEGRAVERVSQLQRYAADTTPGAVVAITLIRDQQQQVVKVTLGELPEASPGIREVSLQYGITVEELTREMARRYDVKPGVGVLIAKVEDGSPAERDGLEKGDIVLEANRTPVTSLNQFERILQQLVAGEDVLVLVSRNKHSRFQVLHGLKTKPK